MNMILCAIYISRKNVKFPVSQSSQTLSKLLLIINPSGTLHMNELLIKVMKRGRAGFIRPRVVHPNKPINLSQQQSVEITDRYIH